MIYYTIRYQNLPGSLNGFRATPALYELLSEVSVVIALKDSLPDYSYDQLAIVFD
jgi:hypothetical protein